MRTTTMMVVGVGFASGALFFSSRWTKRACVEKNCDEQALSAVGFVMEGD